MKVNGYAAGGHDVHTVGLVPVLVPGEDPVVYGRRVHKALGERGCECPRVYSRCRWITFAQRAA